MLSDEYQYAMVPVVSDFLHHFVLAKLASSIRVKSHLGMLSYIMPLHRIHISFVDCGNLKDMIYHFIPLVINPSNAEATFAKSTKMQRFSKII